MRACTVVGEVCGIPYGPEDRYDGEDGEKGAERGDSADKADVPSKCDYST